MKQNLNYHEEIYEFLVSGQSRIPNLEKLMRSLGISTMERVYLNCLKDFRDGIPLCGDLGVVNAILDRSMRVLSKEDLLRYSAISVDESDADLVHKTKYYYFIATMLIIDSMIFHGLYPQSVWIDKVKHKNPPSGEEEKEEWKKKKDAQRFHSIAFVDFKTLCDPNLNQFFTELFELTDGLLPRIDLSTAHDGKHSLRMTLSLVDVLAGTDGIVKAYLPENLFCIRLVHTKEQVTDDIIADGIKKMSQEYPRLLTMASEMKKFVLRKESAKKLSEKIMSTILFKRVWERGIIECKFQEEMNSLLIGKTLWNAVLFIQDRLYHKHGISYTMKTDKGTMSKVKKFNLERMPQKKVIFGAVFTACYDITLSKD